MNIVITGASRGIGYEAAKIFSADRQHQVLAIARSREGLEALANDCGTGKLHILPADLLTEDIADKIIPFIAGRLGRVDILVNNAGMLINKPMADMLEEDFDLLFNANVRSTFLLVKGLLPYFNIGAHIVNIGSMGGYQGSVKFAGLSLYSASKAALAVLTECMALELKGLGISANCLALGSARTEMLEQAFPGYNPPLTAMEMASFIVDFSLRGHQWFNGKILPVALSTP